MEHVDAVGGWYWEDGEREITPEYVMGVISAISDPRSDFYALMRRENVPANELMGRRMEIGVLAVLGQLRARRNWHRIAREWWFGDEPRPSSGAGRFWRGRTRGSAASGPGPAPACLARNSWFSPGEQLRDGAVGEDRADRAGEDVGDAQHLDLVGGARGSAGSCR